MSLVHSTPALPEIPFLPVVLTNDVREGVDGRETKTVSGGTAWQTERNGLEVRLEDIRTEIWRVIHRV